MISFETCAKHDDAYMAEWINGVVERMPEEMRQAREADLLFVPHQFVETITEHYVNSHGVTLVHRCGSVRRRVFCVGSGWLSTGDGDWGRDASFAWRAGVCAANHSTVDITAQRTQPGLCPTRRGLSRRMCAIWQQPTIFPTQNHAIACISFDA
jgi:hypothetical protein